MFAWLVITVALLLSGNAYAEEEDNAGVPQLPRLCHARSCANHPVHAGADAAAQKACVHALVSVRRVCVTAP